MMATVFVIFSRLLPNKWPRNMWYNLLVWIFLIFLSQIQPVKSQLLGSSDYNYNYYEFEDEIEKEIPCEAPPQIAKGETIVWGFGLLLEYRCNAGYFPVGITHGACDLSTGRWTIDPPVCADNGCPDLTPPTHGVVNVDTSGGLAKIVCRQGYFLLGDDMLVCENGQWVGTFPLCAVTAKPNEKTKSRKHSKSHMMKSLTPDLTIDDSDETCFYNHISPPEIKNAVVDTSYVLNEIRHRYVMVATYTCMGGFKLRHASNNQLFCKNLIWSAPVFPECIADDDPCEIDNGACHHYCTPLGSNRHACSCYHGYNLKSDAKTCEDANECVIDNGGCQHECFNTEGSFFCSCAVGFLPKGPKCIDINECEKTENQCPGECINLPGSFRCDCNITGFTTSGAKDHCDDIDECAENNGGCDDICNNKRGSYQCRCETKGRKLGKNGHSCVDVDECSRYKSKVCTNGECTNTDGSYTCSCHDGYRQSENLSSCLDIDECEVDNGGCVQVCENTAGSFKCTCRDGYVIYKDGCQDINECLSDNGDCEDLCVNTEGSYTCECTHIGQVLAVDGRNCSECLKTQFFNRTSTTCEECPSHSHARDSLALSVQDCVCDQGFHGSPKLGVECQDTNECQTGEMSCSHNCVNTVGSAYCDCPEGLSAEEDGVNCKDIDECETSNKTCSQLCDNSVGSYSCRCEAGYALDKDGFSCSDIDECALGFATCESVCINTEGSYSCSCKDGYKLSDNGAFCDDVDECLVDDSPCEQICVNTIGSFTCHCVGDGFKLSKDQSSCIDINECMEGDNPCPSICINTIGSYLCDCDRPGYMLASDASGCEDINECSSDPCLHKCINTPGSFKCACPAGFADPPENNQTVCNECDFGTFRGPEDSECRRCPPKSNTTKTGMTSVKDCVCWDGYWPDRDGIGICVDIDECKTGILKCDQNCVDTEGSAHCICRPGFVLNKDGTTCDDTNECAQHNGGCEHKCVNTPGSFHCQCRGKNFKLADNGLSCEDVNECKSLNSGCQYRCVNTKNGAKCTCPPGHELLPDRKKCRDTNECEQNNGGCTDTCVNTPGSYSCECNIPGYKLYTDGKQCVDVDECDGDESPCEDICVNSVGSYKCYCRKQGYSLAYDKRTCVDIDECAKGRICQHKCINLEGSFRCDCNAGYFKQGTRCSPCLKGTYRSNRDSVVSCVSCPLGMTTSKKGTKLLSQCFCPPGYHGNPDTRDMCRDIDECMKSNGDCHQVCNNTDGSYFCSCNDGYLLDADKKTCRPTKCPLLEAPKFAKFVENNCARMSKGYNVPLGTECTYKCRRFLMLQGDKSRKCLANFTWSGKDPKCDALPCERLPVPTNGHLHPPLCMLPRVPFRTRCTFRCNRGYKRVGRAASKCRANRRWSGKRLPKCVPKSSG